MDLEITYFFSLKSGNTDDRIISREFSVCLRMSMFLSYSLKKKNLTDNGLKYVNY